MKSHIRALKAYASQAVIDSANGVSSHHGFQAFFKSNTSKAYVRRILLDVQLGRSLPVKIDAEAELSVSAPQIICATEGLDEVGPLAELLPWESCADEEDVIGFYFRNTPYIVLCPVFWNLIPDSPAKRYDCGRVESNNQFAGGHAPEDEGIARAMPAQDVLVGYQVYHLFHEIVHFYLGSNTMGGDTVPKEVYDWNECLALNASTSRRNPMNYQLYLASESRPISVPERI